MFSDKDAVHATVLALIGAGIGIGQAMVEKKATIADIIGRAICTGGLAMGAGTVMIWDPTVPALGTIGLAAMMASFGTSALERIFKALTRRR